MDQTKVISLQTAQLINETQVGPKAASLMRLSRAGLVVPAGFCVTAVVFREYIERNNLTNRIKSAADELAKTNPEAKIPVLSNLREAIVKAPLSETTRLKIENHYLSLGADHVAVRSSGTAEDLPDHSFAGQYDTYLGIAGLKDCFEAIKKCWASLWTRRAYEYRENNGFDHLKINMAVIVQSLITADTSGVIFTANPVTGRRGSIVIEACFGLGEALVSGKVTPDRFVVNKSNLKPISRTISEKKIERILEPNGLVQEKTVPAERSTVCCLDKQQIKRLAKYSRKVETEFGRPQDIEWAICRNKIYLLQSRPITALPPEKSWEDRQIWCCNPAKEVIPDVVTPATLSIIDTMLGDFMDPLFSVLCMDRGEHPVYGLVAGRIYFNANIWGAVFRDLPGPEDLDFMEAAGSHKGLQQVAERLRNAVEEDLPDMKFRRLKFFIKIPLIIIGALGYTPDKGRRILAKVGVTTEKWSCLEVASLETGEIVTLCDKMMTDFSEILGNALYLFSILAALPILDMVCTKWLPEGNTNAGKLLAGIGGMVDATAGLDIWQLAAAADSKVEVRELILSNNDWCTTEGKLSQTDSGKEFLAEWNRFMLLHGHHCRGELELYNKRWSETPDYILKFVRSHITQMDKIDPVQNFARAAKQRRQLEQKCRKQLKNPIKRMIFNHLLARVQIGSVFRENVKSEVIKLLTAIRKLLIELGKRLNNEGILKNNDDIFFLKIEEIAPVVQGKADFDINKVIAARRADYNKNSSVTPPDVVIGKFDPDNYTPDAIDEHAEVLNGLAVSPGVATGKARVILRADTEEQLLAGEILVAPFTDPGWTPYFVPAAAIVMDEGGVISHGSIVAREYGIPAVVNVGSSTKIIKTGQMIQVDGNSGIVKILSQISIEGKNRLT
ncbi:MAG: PEP/pyruvate-binding domain-containing protein [Planctomycetota bacterium]|jgi:pyruvate,water dikinase